MEYDYDSKIESFEIYAMKAIVCTKYGSPEVLQLKEVEKPVPADHEVLIKVIAASVTAADSMIRRGTPFYGRFFIGLKRPKHPIPGTGFAGEIEAVGKKVSLFKKGDAVFGETGLVFSANAEYVCLSEEGVISSLPTKMTYEEAAPVCDGALTSWCFLKDIGKIRSGQRVLIYGASGSLGSAAVQIANYFGAEVAGVCSTANLDRVRALGATTVIDYTQEDFTQNGQRYDIIYDTVGKSSFSRCKSSLSTNGVYLSPVLSLVLLVQMLLTSKSGGKKAKFSATGLRPASELCKLLDELKQVIDAGHLKSVIDRRYPIEQAAEAHRYVDTGRKKGNAVITM